MRGPDPADPRSIEVYDNYPAALKAAATAGAAEGVPVRRYRDFTESLKKGALKGARLGLVRDFMGGDPEIDTLARQAVAKTRDLGAEVVEIQLDPEVLDFFVRKAGPNIRRPADYRFKKDFETYLATFRPSVPKIVADFVRIYQTTVARSALPVEDSVMDLLNRSLVTSTDDPVYRNLIDQVIPTATRLMLGIFEVNQFDALYAESRRIPRPWACRCTRS